MTDMEKLREIVALAHEGMEGCDQPQFGIFNEIIEIANTPTTENKGGDKPCYLCEGCKLRSDVRPASPTKADKVEPLAVFKSMAVELDKKTPCKTCVRFPLIERGEDCACLWDTVVSATMFENTYKEGKK